MSYRTVLTPQQLLEFQSEIALLTHGFDRIGDHAIITDAQGTILYANDAAERHTGFSRDEMIGKNAGDLWGGHMDQKFYEDMWHTLKVSKLPFHGEVKNKNKDGTEYWQELKIFPVFDEHNAIRFMIGMEPDITMRKASEKVQDQYTQELEKFNTYMRGEKPTVSELAEELKRMH